MCKLLMIDDNPIEHLIMQKMLANYHLFPNAVHSIDAKIIIQFFMEKQKLKEQLPDLIFLDLNMPRFNGWDFLTRFNELYPLLAKTIDVYIVSSSINPKDHIRCKKYAFVKSFLMKPLKKQTLETVFSNYSKTH